MINFFNKPLKKLAEDDTFFKYSRYAIGEITLMVNRGRNMVLPLKSKRNMFLGFFCLALLSNCKQDKISLKAVPIAPFVKDLEEIKKDGKLKVLIAYSGTSYFLYRGEPMGYEYELLQRLAEHLNLELEIKISNNLDMLLINLAKGNADLIAYGLAITDERKKIASFTDYLYLTEQVLVQKKPRHWRKMTVDNINKSIIQNPLELIGDTVSVRKNTSYFERLTNLSKEMGGEIVIDTLKGNLSTAEIIKMVVDDKIKYTIADKNLASINASYFPILDTKVPVSFSQRIAWAVRPNSPELLNATNSWIKKYRKNPEYNVIYNKYFKNKSRFKKRVKSDFYSVNYNEISQYDNLIKTNAELINWDWRLIAAIIYQESRFKNEASSWSGAEGLMQMMPGTAEDMGVKDRLNPEENIKGGVRYLKQLYDAYSDITDREQRIKFTLASYNCGYFHVKDAQKLARLNGLKSTIWDDNVNEMILALTYPKNYNKKEIKYGYVNGQEPFNYVNEIFNRYEHYIKFITE
ncbi:MAG: membrane-bound lytic murein transglycosylase F [Maribacter sp.]|jgi:membrane-bound lytic murein transglycosylase F